MKVIPDVCSRLPMAATKEEDKPEVDKRLFLNLSLDGVGNLPVYRDDLAKLLQWRNIMRALVLVCIAAVLIQSSKIAANEQCKSEYCRILK